ncbi:oligosaccharide flippase family protein [Chryseobacterium sp. RG1]|uniref:Oligosaccharide flippase family protein n=1 Tax=Chryseobacterium tagetis TaxID=2801334 RepID=A0ABS8A559_9FLAO|nr:oligosaccharide flippase family protein [Chryseobacterium tagetis]MCA6069103.1 oligosaccharide flippase family protein [Chryseobacterium tagetis]
MEQNKKSQKNILKATSIVGGSQLATILIGLIRNKLIAVLLGPTGVGINAILQNTVDLVRQATGFGINFSGVKEIAAASSTEDEIKISRTITILRRWSLYTGILGMFVAIILCLPLSYYAFDNKNYAVSIAIISVTLLTTSVSSGQIALLQGLRKMSIMAKVSVYGAGLSLLFCLPLYWWLGLKGIVPGIVVSGIMSLIVSYTFASKIKVQKPNITFKETVTEGLGMAKLGFLIILTSLMVTATMYAVRSFIAQKMNLDAVGYFVAVWSISNTYVNIILNAMLSDFFPRLSEAETFKDYKKSNSIINEQLELSLIIAGPLFVLLIGAANLIIRILFTSDFLIAVSVLQWQLFAGFFAIISWCLGVMFLSKNKGGYSMLTEGIWSATYYLFIILFWNNLGFLSLGIGYFVAHFIKIIFVYLITTSYWKFFFDTQSLKTISIYSILIITIFINVILIKGIYQYIFSAIISLIAILISYYRISKIIDFKNLLKKKLK